MSTDPDGNWTRAVGEGELAEGGRLVVQAGGQEVLLIRHRGHVYATESRCPHMYRALKDGSISDDGVLTCALHHSQFELATGRCLAWAPWPPIMGPALGAVRPRRDLRIFPTRLQDGGIWVQVS